MTVQQGTVLSVVGLVVSALVGWGAATARVQDIDTREREHAETAQRDIQRVSRDVSEMIAKIDTNLQWLIKEFIEVRAEVRRQERERQE